MTINILRKLKLVVKSFVSRESAWLYKNRFERMDANRNDIFELSRAAFHLDRYRFASQFVKNKIILDAACGTGYGSRILKDEGEAKIVIGLDKDFHTVKYAASKYSSEDIIFVNADIAQLPFKDECFQAVVSFETIEHTTYENNMLKEIKRILTNQGQFILSTPNDWGLGELAPFHVRTYTLEKLKDTISRYFRIIDIFNQNSGTIGRKENHDQPRGIIKTTDENFRLAECYIVITEKP